MSNYDGKILNSIFGPTADCVAIDELSLLLDGRRGEEQKRRAEAHVEGCAHCRAEIALLQEFESSAIRPHEQRDVNWIVARLRKNQPAQPLSWWKRMWTVPMLAPITIGLATALIAIGIGLEMRHSPGQPFSPSSGGSSGSGEVMRSLSVDVVGPIGDLAQRPAELRWKPVAGASRYMVRVFEVDRTELWSTTVKETSVALPSVVQAKIVPLKTLMWEVRAIDASGSVLANSGPESFRLDATSSR